MRPAAVSRSVNSDPQLISSPRFRFPLQATMICIDNSEWMRNGDYAPSRFQAQTDAVNLICGAKTQVPTPVSPSTDPIASFVWVRVSGIPDLIASVCWWVQSNPENTVGVMTMAGKGVRVLVTPTSDLGKILACMHGKLTSIPKPLLYYRAESILPISLGIQCNCLSYLISC